MKLGLRGLSHSDHILQRHGRARQRHPTSIGAAENAEEEIARQERRKATTNRRT